MTMMLEYYFEQTREPVKELRLPAITGDRAEA
jgi:hypothetical protein